MTASLTDPKTIPPEANFRIERWQASSGNDRLSRASLVLALLTACGCDFTARRAAARMASSMAADGKSPSAFLYARDVNARSRSNSPG